MQIDYLHPGRKRVAELDVNCMCLPDFYEAPKELSEVMKVAVGKFTA